jgi:SIR2-like domain/AAA domain
MVVSQKLFKIHGCISQDASFGDKASMILTESDYVDFEKYRQAMFASLQAALLTKDVLIVGQSLRDRHLQDIVRRVLHAKLEGSVGQVYALIYDRDDLRAPLLEDQGVRIAFGGIDDLVHALAKDHKNDEAARSNDPAQEDVVPLSVVSTVDSVASGLQAQPNVKRMFNGGAATYADIRARVTFERVLQNELLAKIVESETSIVAITGAAGVGKTTFARQLLVKLHEAGFRAWEHRPDFPFLNQNWIAIESKLREANQRGVLLLDECTHFMRATNSLVEHLAKLETSNLSIIVTANSAQWVPRIKSPRFSEKGVHWQFSALHNAEIYSLLSLVEHNPQVAALVHADFKKQRRESQFAALRQKCGADMFVCLKNIFANESLDVILLQEYDALEEPLREYYRFVAALESIGTRVHRQLIIRMLRTDPVAIGAILDRLSGIVDEYTVSERNGIFGWSTRHLVIARRVTEFKFSGLGELTALFEAVISNLNPLEPIEIQTVRAICDTEFGIGRIADHNTRKELYRQLIDVAPGERIPWHRLIRELLSEEDTESTEYVIRDAEAAVGVDAPISRFKIRLLVTRAMKTKGIAVADRLAMLKHAYEQAMRNTELFRADKYSYSVLCDVAIDLANVGGGLYLLEEAIKHMRDAASRILDPEMDSRLQQYEKTLAKLR